MAHADGFDDRDPGLQPDGRMRGQLWLVRNLVRLVVYPVVLSTYGLNTEH
jgi:hypothetical protein